jgi:lipopolysaccharide transport system ATP-binding protein
MNVCVWLDSKPEKAGDVPSPAEPISARSPCPMSENAIVVDNLSKRYLIGHRSSGRYKYTALRDVVGRELHNFTRKALDLVRGRQVVQGDEVEEFWALKDVSFEVKQGEVLGIIGRNGAGKSTLLKILSRITEPTAGRITIRGRVSSLLEVGTGFHPELTGRENIFLNGAILGMTQREIRAKFDEIVAFAEVEKFLDTPVKHYSSGMYVRLAFAVAAHLEPEILIIDEVLAVGDAEFQKKCIGKMNEVSREQGRTVLFVSHNMAAMRSFCSRGLLFDKGNLTLAADIDDCVHRYTSSAANVASGGWFRPSEKQSGPLHFKEIMVALLGHQPTPLLQIDCLLEGQSSRKPAFVAFDIADSIGTVFMQALPTIEPFIKPEPSTQKFRFEIQLPALVPGRYFVSAWVGPHNTETYDNCLECLSFEISESPTIGRVFPHSAEHGFLVPTCTIERVT